MSRSVLKRVVTIVAGLLFLVGGFVVATGGGLLMAVVGSDSSLSSGREHVSTPASALVAPVDKIEGVSHNGTVLGQPRLRISVAGAGRAVFIGVGPAAEVERYLAGASYDAVLDLKLEPFRLRTERQGVGDTSPAPPGGQSLWVAKSSGPNAAVDWKIRGGSYRLVVMNADARPGVAVEGRVAVAVPELYRLAVGVLIAGIAGVLIGATLLVVGLRLSRRSQSMAQQSTDGALSVFP